MAESAATDSGVALSPSITSAALPGRTSRTVKTTTDAASKVSSRLAKRLKRKKLMAVARRAQGEVLMMAQSRSRGPERVP